MRRMVRVASPDLDDNVSAHLEGARPLPPLPPFAGDAVADLVVIGAGFTGMSTAWHASAAFPDRRIVVLEARKVANGASGRTAGMVLNWINGVGTHDPETTRRVWRCTLDGIDGLERLVHELGGVRWRRDGSLEVVTDPARAEAAHQRVERLRSWGLPLQWLDRDTLRRQLALEGVAGATLDPTAGQINGVDLLRAMVPPLRARGVAVHEDSPVVRIEEGETITVTTPEGRLRTRAIVLATNGYTPRLGYFRSAIVPLHSHIVATAPLDEEAWARLGWRAWSGFADDLDRIAYAARMADGRLLFGGGSNAAYDYGYGGRTRWDGPAERWVGAVTAKLHGYLPGLAEVPVTHRWSGTLGLTLNRKPSMGVRGRWKNVYYALGYSGHGVVLANLAGRVLTDIMRDHLDPWRDLPFYQLRLPYMPPDPLRWVGYQAFTRATGRSPRTQD